MKVFFNDGYEAPRHGANITRMSGEIAAALATGRVPAVDLHLLHGHRVRDHQLGPAVTGRS